jgi:hypothetical protein
MRQQECQGDVDREAQGCQGQGCEQGPFHQQDVRTPHRGVSAGGGLQERQRAGGELVLLDESDLIFSVKCKMQD